MSESFFMLFVWKTKKVFLLAVVATMAGSALLLVSSCISQHQTCVLDSVSAIDSFPQCLDDGVEQEVDLEWPVSATSGFVIIPFFFQP